VTRSVEVGASRALKNSGIRASRAAAIRSAWTWLEEAQVRRINGASSDRVQWAWNIAVMFTQKALRCNADWGPDSLFACPSNPHGYPCGSPWATGEADRP
jgi:hypothetical protein